MTKMYLLWEWTDEREAKIHHGIFTSQEKAEAASIKVWQREAATSGVPDEELGDYIVKWDIEDPADFGYKQYTGTGEDLLYAGDSDTPFEIEEFDLDVLDIMVDWDSATGKPIVESYTF